MKRKAVIFDLDGTLVDSSDAVTERFRQTFDYFGQESPSDEIFKGMVGPPASSTFDRYFDPNIAKKGLAYFRNLATLESASRISLFPGIVSMLDKLSAQGIQCAIATSKPEEEARKIVCNLQIEKYFEDVCGSPIEYSNHEKADSISAALLNFRKFELKELIMVGDRIYDVDGANKCGIDSIFAAWSGVAVSEGNNAVASFNDPADMAEYLIRTHDD